MTTRIGVITDAHANLPATTAALRQLDRIGCDRIIHTGDAIGIGPHPREVMDLLLARDDVQLLMGNHDELFVQGLPEQRPEGMSESEFVHQQWTHAQLPDDWRGLVAAWPYEVNLKIGTTGARFRHYFQASTGAPRAAFILHPTVPELEGLTAQPTPDVFFYGHHHPLSDLQGRTRFVNPGALGCPHDGPIVARYAVLSIEASGDQSVELGSVEYDHTQLWNDFEERDVPGRGDVLRIFFGHPRHH